MNKVERVTKFFLEFLPYMMKHFDGDSKIAGSPCFAVNMSQLLDTLKIEHNIIGVVFQPYAPKNRRVSSEDIGGNKVKFHFIVEVFPQLQYNALDIDSRGEFWDSVEMRVDHMVTVERNQLITLFKAGKLPGTVSKEDSIKMGVLLAIARMDIFSWEEGMYENAPLHEFQTKTTAPT